MILPSEKKIQSIFWIFLLIHLTLWTSVAGFSRLNLPLDAIEGITWGQHLQWGYDKNPYISAWLSTLAAYLSPQSGWLTYFICQLSVVICFWAIFQFSKEILTPFYALFSVLILEGIQYYNFHAIDLSDNALELSTWALIILYFDKSLRQNKILDWCLLGFFAGLSMMTKYYTALLLCSLLLMLISHVDWRKHFRTPNPYYAVAIFLIVVFPHVYWLYQHEFTTFHYTIERMSVPKPYWTQHLTFPLQFMFEQGLILIPTLIMFSLFLIKYKKNSAIKVSQYHKHLLFYAGLGPFILTLLIALCSGIKLRSAWGQPLLSLWGVMLFVWFKPQISLRQYRLFLIIFSTTLILTGMIYLFKQYHPTMVSSAIFPGKTIATVLESDWQRQYHVPLRYTAGPRWLAGNVSFYTKNKPDVYMEWNPKVNPWLKDPLLRQHGGIFIWDLNKKKNQWTYDEMKNRYPTLTLPKIMHFSYYRNAQLPPVKLMYAFLPPTKVLDQDPL